MAQAKTWKARRIEFLTILAVCVAFNLFWHYIGGHTWLAELTIDICVLIGMYAVLPVLHYMRRWFTPRE